MGRWSLRRLGPQGLAARLEAQPAFSPAQVRQLRLIAAVYPVAVVLLILTVGVAAGRLLVATAVFALVVAIQLLVISPVRRRQVLGLARERSAD